jgi:hypothetical protein
MKCILINSGENSFMKYTCTLSQFNLTFQQSIISEGHIKIHRTVIVLVVLYGSGTWSVTPIWKIRLRVVGVCRKIFGPQKEKVAEDWGKRP